MLLVIVCASLLVLGRKHMGGGELSLVSAQGHRVIICTALWLLSTCSKDRESAVFLPKHVVELPHKPALF